MKLFEKIKNQFKIKRTNGLYPFVYLNEVYSLKFKIYNEIEEFRLKNWGGEKNYVIEMINELKDNDIFYDIGSSVGLMSVIAAKVLKGGKVISFEPDPENIARLSENYKLNSLKNFSTKEMAVGFEKSSMQLYTKGSGNFSPSLQKVNGITDHITVKVDSIDNLLKEKKLPYPTVVKMDIEGAEMMALKGMSNLLKSKERPRLLFIELHPDFLPSFNTSTSEIINFLKGFDYTMDTYDERDRQILCKLVRS